MINSINSHLNEDDELTARQLRDKLQGNYPDIPDVLISTVKRYDKLCACKNVTGSAKTGHNCTSLNLQYKALNTLGAICVLLKNSENFLNVSFLVKEGHNNKNLDIILFAYSRGVRKSLFRCSRPKDS